MPTPATTAQPAAAKGSRITITTLAGPVVRGLPDCDDKACLGEDEYTCGYDVDVDWGGDWVATLVYVKIGGLLLARDCALQAWGAECVREAEDELALADADRRISEWADMRHDLRQEGVL